MSRNKTATAEPAVSVRLLEPVQTATARYEPGEVIVLPEAVAAQLIASNSAQLPAQATLV